jgi:hypothetical protein
MKNTLVSLFLLAFMQQQIPSGAFSKLRTNPQPGRNVIIITTDGFRWQELFSGADPALINSEKFTPDTSTMKAMYWAPTAEERRKKLMPFCWNVIGTKGQLYGNRTFQNKVNTANLFAISYPGYNELLSGFPDPEIKGNEKVNNPNETVLEYLSKQPGFEGKVAAFASWNVFPFILNRKRSGLPMNAGYEKISGPSAAEDLVNQVQEESIAEKSETRYDALTFVAAKEYLKQYHPRVLFLGLGETDDFAHQGRYDLYLSQATKVDQMIAEIWHWVQSTPGYKDNTTLIITTDHGRGNKNNWSKHNEFVNGSSETWIAMMGPDIQPAGEVKDKEQHYQMQLAKLIAGFAGMEFHLPDTRNSELFLMN